MPQKNNLLAVSSLLAGALVWGLIWYPYRALEAAGVGGALASFLTYALALLPGLLLLRGRGGEFTRSPGLLAAISLSAGWCNLAYVLAMIHGEVMQVMLLFYLAPLWTVVLAALLLGERPGPVGYVVVALAAAGAMIMLWQPGAVLPLPRTGAQWLALSSGMAFALSNVLSRKARHIDVSVKAVSVWAGVSLLALPITFAVEQPMAALQELEVSGWVLIALLATVILSVNLVVQHGLTHTPANRAIVIFLSELVFAALAAYWLAFEAMDWRQWLGGAMVVAATLCSGRLAPAPAKSVPA